MGINAISWRRIKTLDEQLGERFVHVYTNSHHQHWLWVGFRIDGTAAVIDTRSGTVDELDDDGSSSAQQLLKSRAPRSEEQRDFLQTLDDRAAELQAMGAGEIR